MKSRKTKREKQNHDTMILNLGGHGEVRTSFPNLNFTSVYINLEFVDLKNKP
jgi:hypothetical protein